MILDRSTARILAAAKLEDLALLESARHFRQDDIASLGSSLGSGQPSVELCDSIAASIAAGEEAKRAIRVIKHRLLRESRRLANIENGFLCGERLPLNPRLDYKG
jgi:hypothetical protein